MFSVVIPLFNKAHTILETLDTVLNQTYKQFEVLIVDDGSTDNGVEVIKKFISDSRVRIIKQENQGVSAARNTGVTNSNFNYIAFLDGDDQWLPEYLSTMKKAIDLYPTAGMLCCAGIVKNSNGSIGHRLASKYKNKILEIDFFENPHVFSHSSAIIVDKEQFNKTNGFPVGMKRNEDFALFFSLALITQVIYCGFPLSIYVGGVEGQATTTDSVNNNIGLLNQVVTRQNLVFENWIKAGKKNHNYIIFMKYELRHIFMWNSIQKRGDINQYYLKNLHPQILKEFSYFEKLLLTKVLFRRISILYFLITKLRWRMRGYPRVGEIKDTKPIMQKKL